MKEYAHFSQDHYPTGAVCNVAVTLQAPTASQGLNWPWKHFAIKVLRSSTLLGLTKLPCVCTHSTNVCLRTLLFFLTRTCILIQCKSTIGIEKVTAAGAARRLWNPLRWKMLCQARLIPERRLFSKGRRFVRSQIFLTAAKGQNFQDAGKVQEWAHARQINSELPLPITEPSHTRILTHLQSWLNTLKQSWDSRHLDTTLWSLPIYMTARSEQENAGTAGFSLISTLLQMHCSNTHSNYK